MRQDRIARAAAEALRDWQDHKRFAEASLTVSDKLGQVIPYRLAPAPQRVYEACERQREHAKPIRTIELKARQVFVSTYIASRFMWRVPFRPGQKAMVVAHEGDAALNIFRYYDWFRRSYKPFHGVDLPAIKRDSESRIEFTNGSRIDIHTANNLTGGRSRSIRYLHLSEYAFYRDAGTLMLGLMNAVPDDPDTEIHVESTANGVGGAFYDLWQAANDPASGSAYTPVFFAWWEHPEYTVRIEQKELARFQDSVTNEEWELVKQFNLTLGQIAWRRWAIRNKCNGSLDQFRQEYPATAEEAFIFSGRPRFSHYHLGKMRVIDAPAVGELELVQNGPRQSVCFLQDPEGKGALSVWKRPQEGHRYVIGADPIGGSDAAEKPRPGSENPDYSVAAVLDADSGEQVAVLRGRIQPGPFADYVALLAEWYLWAFVVPEANGEGLAFVDGLIHAGYPPALIYHRRPPADEQFTSMASSQLERIGWKTTTITRPQLISTLDMAIRDLAIAVRSRNTVQELRTFVIKSSGRQEHQDGCHDDEVFALGLAVIGVQTMPRDKSLDNFRRQQSTAGRAQRDGAANATVQRYGRSRYPAGDRGVTVRF